MRRRSSEPGKKSGGGSGAMMSMRSGFKGVAGSIVGQQAKTKRGRRMVDIFWWVVTAAVGALAIYMLYNRFK
ncbi:MAG: hypothetical protein RBU30_20855 [Polyangia bacterium]|nr:hypothetical protein [Polyangia bacterium]